MKFRFEKKFIFMFLFIFSLLFSQSIYLYRQNLSSSIGYEKLVIRLKDKLPAEKGFDIRQVSELNRIVSTEMVTYYSFNDSAVSSRQTSRQIQVYGVLGNYNEFNRVQLKQGSFIDENDNRLKRNVVVIEDSAAESLFRSEDVIGLELEVYNRKFKIIGIVSTESTKIEKLLDTKKPSIYIPMNTMNDLIPDAYIGTIEYMNTGKNLDIDFIRDKIFLMGKDSDDFVVEDLNIIGTQQRQKYDILIFILGVYSIYMLIRLIASIAKYIISYSKSSLNDHYFFAMIKNGKRVYINGTLATLGIITLGIFIWNRISFSLYISPDKIPDNPASIIQILEMLTRSITEFINYNYTYPIYMIRVSSFFQKISSIVFFLGIIFEILYLSYIKRRKSGKIKDDVNFLLNMGICLIFSVLSSIFLLYLLGLSVTISFLEMLVIWISFIIISFSHKEEYLLLIFRNQEEIQNSI